ncbi:predicted protein [Uncinocarpus reesii 1704]|uniref:Endoglucanase n=1 Tax=Uncinocarpus reesii (strain UAMH 1704) TaxID=336963 RepID=C4JPQ2_UNCRE|nr:uncharacterized protein UREG_03224 [Uncinocarpus reesii 1704]EEP78378.1 predicted protein [Uncinocarpus reesii 1704]
MHFMLYLLGAFCAAQSVLGHMEMRQPYALMSRFDPHNNSSQIDYDNKSPLSPDGKNFPCRGHHKTVEFRPVATYEAGKDYTMILDGTATHHGGSCQISLSYDKGKSWKVIKSFMGACPLAPDQKYSFRVPADVDNGKAMLAWTWFNLVGAREMYMNCAHVMIEKGKGGGIKKLPTIFEANIGNKCHTSERKETVFRHAGPAVEYGPGVNPTSTPFPDCDGNTKGMAQYIDQLGQLPLWGWF